MWYWQICSVPCNSCSRRPEWGYAELNTWWDRGRILETRKAHPAPSYPAAHTEPYHTHWAGRRAGSTDTGLELRNKIMTTSLLHSLDWYGALFPHSPISLCTQTYFVAGWLCSDRPSAQSETRCWESLMDSSPHSRGSTQRGRGWLDSLWTVVAKSTLNATSCQSPRPLSVRKGNDMRLKWMQIIVASLMQYYTTLKVYFGKCYLYRHQQVNNTILPDPLVGSTGLDPQSAGETGKNVITKIRKRNFTDWLIIFLFPVYFDVVELHSAAVRCSEGSSELDLLSQLTPLPAVRFSTLNLKGTISQSTTMTEL